MVWAALLLTAALYCSGSSAQEIVTQPASESVSPGGTVTLPCTAGGFSISDRSVRWYQQKTGERPRYLLSFTSDSSKHQGEGVPDRFSGSKDNSKNTGYLTIKSVSPDDEAEYYCCMWPQSNTEFIFGPGTKLTVPTGEVKAPALFIFGPSAEELQTDSCSTVCTATDFTPGAASIQWAVDGNLRTNGVSTTPIGKQSGSLYMVSSILTMPTSDYRGAAQISCKVTHQGKEMDKTLKTSECN